MIAYFEGIAKQLKEDNSSIKDRAKKVRGASETEERARRKTLGRAARARSV
jgi:hypothetical protein